MRTLTLLLLASFTFTSTGAVATAQRRPQTPPPARGLLLDSLKATIRITDTTATTEIEQVFLNRSQQPSEEVYLWPIPEGASVTDFQLWIDGKSQKAELLDKDRARGVYEDIVRSKRDPGLLEWAGLGCVRCSVFPVPPMGEGRVKLKYTNTVSSTANLFEYTLPTRLAAIAPSGIRSFVIDGTLESQRPLSGIYSPTHSLDVRQTGPGGARFSFESSGVEREKDFILNYLIPESEFGALFLAHRSPGADGFFTLNLAPRFDLAPAMVQPKDVIFVCDTSGSMEGAKIAQAKKALDQCIGRLAANDRFSLIKFSTEVDAFRPDLADVTKENLDAAREWVRKIEARGGTNIDDAISAALKVKKTAGRLTMIFFMTDGLPTVGIRDIPQLLKRVNANNTDGLRIFTFGVGYDVNTQLLDAIAKNTRADREYVRPEEDVELKVSALFDKVASPVLSNVSIRAEGAQWSDVFPRELPDVFRGSQILVTGRYRGQGPQKLILSGKLGSAEREWTYNINFPAVEERHDSIPALWATRKVGYLMDEIRLHGDSRELVEEIKRLAKEYNIITPYTSFLVVEENRRLSRARGEREASGDDLALSDLESSDSKRKLEDLAKSSTGREAVENSKDAGGLAGATSNNPGASGPRSPGGPATPSAGGARAAQGDWGDRDNATEATKRISRNVGSRVFQNINNVWVDSSFTEKDRANIVNIIFLSEEYFKLLRNDASLAQCFALGSRLLVKSKGAFYEIVP